MISSLSWLILLSNNIADIQNDWFSDSTTYFNKFERDYNNNGKFLQYRFLKAYPISITSMPISYDASQLLKCTVSFTYTRYIVTRESGQVSGPLSGPLSGSFTDPNSPLSQTADRALVPGSGPGFSDSRLEAGARAALGF